MGTKTAKDLLKEMSTDYFEGTVPVVIIKSKLEELYLKLFNRQPISKEDEPLLKKIIKENFEYYASFTGTVLYRDDNNVYDREGDCLKSILDGSYIKTTKDEAE